MPTSGQLAIVTGASSGIGHATAVALARHGYHVLAGVRRPADVDFGGQPGIEVVRLDITNDDDVRAVAERVGDGSRYARIALVNNAGVSSNSPVELLPLAGWRDQLEVNLLGHIRMITALLPALTESEAGRIVNVSSAATLVTSPTTGAYAAAKAGLEKVSDALRRELVATRTKVVVVQPGAVKTGGWEKAMNSHGPELTPAQHGRYDDLTAAVDRTAQRFADGGSDVAVAVRTIVRAVESPRPRTHCRIGTDAKLMRLISGVLPPSAQDRLVGVLAGTRGIRPAD
ncbi:SDR family NAD(P)-dependent oxidoreductase [Actinoplanes bogorensis]|uniref:SDR family NAD(P)-dependent oxidoreductase n=1 Tax=Paractinoplanes bogorensis TaxID=1610840 RepID=A0ABS5YG29_9ACTN|nr:SDR family NAD(P)-dependent oxidoreductase [Actinoplanes bogorensis]MBU2661926.1 SDR family NAD(P)-dependent oxidoreductase [Actinoplanes bogorensis]